MMSELDRNEWGVFVGLGWVGCRSDRDTHSRKL